MLHDDKNDVFCCIFAVNKNTNTFHCLWNTTFA